MQAKVQRRFPAVRAYQKRRLVFTRQEVPSDDDSDLEGESDSDSDSDSGPEDEDDEDEDEDDGKEGNKVNIGVPPTLSTPVRPSQLPSPSPSSIVTGPTFTPSTTVVTSTRLPLSSSIPTPSTSTRTPLSSAATVTPAPTTSTSVTVVPPSASATRNVNNEIELAPTGETKTRSTPVGAIVGVIIAFLVIGLPLGIYLYRRRSIKNRLKLRGWAYQGHESPAPISPWIDYREKWKFTKPPPAPIISAPIVTPTPTTASCPSPVTPLVGIVNRPPYVPSSRPPSPPLVSRFSTTTSGTTSPGFPPPGRPRSASAKAGTPIVGASRIMPMDVPEYATVMSTYTPVLPDELSIESGDMLRVLAEYDDGWALCLHRRGDKGMVPLKCFDRPNQRKSMRASSLAPKPI